MEYDSDVWDPQVVVLQDELEKQKACNQICNRKLQIL